MAKMSKTPRTRKTVHKKVSEKTAKKTVDKAPYRRIRESKLAPVPPHTCDFEACPFLKCNNATSASTCVPPMSAPPTSATPSTCVPPVSAPSTSAFPSIPPVSAPPSKAFTKRLNHLVQSGAFNGDAFEKGHIRQHVQKLLEAWECDRQGLTFHRSPVTISYLKTTLKAGGGQYEMPKMHNSELSKFKRFASSSKHLEIRDKSGDLIAYRFESSPLKYHL